MIVLPGIVRLSTSLASQPSRSLPSMAWTAVAILVRLAGASGRCAPRSNSTAPESPSIITAAAASTSGGGVAPMRSGAAALGRGGGTAASLMARDCPLAAGRQCTTSGVAAGTRPSGNSSNQAALTKSGAP